MNADVLYNKIIANKRKKNKILHKRKHKLFIIETKKHFSFYNKTFLFPMSYYLLVNFWYMKYLK